jgi:hypothetical protein
MSRSGELILKRVIVEYNQVAGVGHSMRQALAREVPLFKAKYPTVVVDIRPRDTGSMVLAGIYKDGSNKTFPIHALGAQGIALRLHQLVNTANDIDETFGPKHVYRHKSSVQGNWNPWLWMAERHEHRVQPLQWDRQLSEEEWDYYVARYGDQMLDHEKKVRQSLGARENIHSEHTAEVQRRWGEHVKPYLQTDVEQNLEKMKEKAARGEFPEPVRFGEYNLFAMPDVSDLGSQTVQALRGKELKREAEWWTARKRTLKPPA